MKFAVLTDRHEPGRGGLERQVDGWARWLAGRGHEVHLFVFHAPAPAPSTLTVHRIDPAGSALDRARRLEAAARAIDGAFLHDFGAGIGGDLFMPLYGARWAGRDGQLRARRPLRRLRLSLHPRWRRQQREASALEAAQLAGTSLIVACSGRVAADLRKAGARCPIEILHNPVDPDHHRPPDKALRARRRAERGWGEDATVFLQVAHDFHLKGVANSIRALARAARTGADLHLAIAGRGPDPVPFRALAQRLGIDDRVHFLGAMADTREAYEAADVLLHPALYDACSLTLQEGMACGLPVIASMADGSAELVTEGVQGWRVSDPRNLRMIAGAMRGMLEPGLRRAMGAQARRLAEQNDIGSNFSRLEAICLAKAGRQVSVAG